MLASGRASRGVAMEAQRELAWMDAGGGVQLMRIQPIQVHTALTQSIVNADYMCSIKLHFFAVLIS